MDYNVLTELFVKLKNRSVNILSQQNKCFVVCYTVFPQCVTIGSTQKQYDISYTAYDMYSEGRDHAGRVSDNTTVFSNLFEGQSHPPRLSLSLIERTRKI
jgi:hypothetical protein